MKAPIRRIISVCLLTSVALAGFGPVGWKRILPPGKDEKAKPSVPGRTERRRIPSSRTNGTYREPSTKMELLSSRQAFCPRISAGMKRTGTNSGQEIFRTDRVQKAEVHGRAGFEPG